ncbi:YbaB/EbfC family nucleoid-associated protein [Amycolatopsis suaedae]|uniref:YbaB/EbfC family DNA-binding protein n=1 Tax=Amycolatopsis suaedae TaxID=2510978 RepID=A0A4Q7J2H1_9PSEU|nr:YbaB/EbfC family nucleoid-associated protein [Amycolatopsis suaedae]RZQ60746.1 YbaB/EbfC family DNA-binding protein [Amycolatopsis suaedae]
MADLPDVERMVSDWQRDVTEKARRYDELRARVEEISVTESAAGGAVTVTVGPNGAATDVRMTQAVTRMSPDDLAAGVLWALRKAQSRYPERLAEIAEDVVGDDPTARQLVDTAAAAFPPVVGEEPAAPEPMGRELRVEQEAEDRPAPPAPVRTPRRRRPDEDDAFEHQTFMRRQ